ncbi:OTUB1 thioesterase, partial [Amia calva]|nr:OTUB1 thioesterase [Amia calva]
MAQQDRIQQEIATSNPLVSERQELSVLKREYAQEDTVYQQKIKDLHKKYSYIRKTRPDGNCFYRAFGFSHLESLLDDSKELQRFKAVAAKSKLDLVNQGFTEFTIEDFHNTASLGELLGTFNDQSTSDYLVVYLRLLTSGYLQREGGFFQHFIEGGRSVKEFCQQVRGAGGMCVCVCVCERQAVLLCLSLTSFPLAMFRCTSVLPVFPLIVVRDSCPRK